VLPGNLNRFFAAKAAGKLAAVEDARLRTVKFSLCWPARIVSGALQLVALGFSVWVLATGPGLLLHPFGWFSLLVGLGAAVAGAGTFLLYVVIYDSIDVSAFWNIEGDGNAVVEFFAYCTDDLGFPEQLAVACLFSLVPLSCAIAAAPLLQHSLGLYFAIALLGQLLLWATALNVFDSSEVYYLSRPSGFIDMYEDPWSGHWLGQATVRGTQSKARATLPLPFGLR
jgi:hypothetical protein